MLYVVTLIYHDMDYRKYDYFKNKQLAIEWAESCYPEVDSVKVEEYVERDGKYHITSTILHWDDDDDDVC